MPSNNTLILFIFILTLGIGSVAAQAEQGVSTSASGEPAETGPGLQPGLQFIFEPSSALKPASDPGYSAGADFTLVPSLKLSPAWALSSLWTVTQVWTGARATTLTRSELRGTWTGGEISKGLTYGSYGSVFLPLPHDKRADESFQLGLKVAPKLALDLAAVSPIPLSFEYEPGLTRNFHEYTTSARGADNAQWVLGQRGLVNLDLGKRWYASSQLVYYSLFDYAGQVTNKFKWDQEVGFAPNSHWSLAAGLSNYAGGMRANGQESNLGLFDYETTVIYGTFGFSI